MYSIHLEYSIYWCPKAAAPSRSCIALLKFRGCKLEAGLMYTCAGHRSWSAWKCLKLNILFSRPGKPWKCIVLGKVLEFDSTGSQLSDHRHVPAFILCFNSTSLVLVIGCFQCIQSIKYHGMISSKLSSLILVCLRRIFPLLLI